MTEIEINIHLRVQPSKQLLNNLLSNLLEYLLFARSQIPFSYDLFNKMFSNVIERNEAAGKEQNNWKIEKQLKLAGETLERICSLKQVSNIKPNFEKIF